MDAFFNIDIFFVMQDEIVAGVEAKIAAWTFLPIGIVQHGFLYM